MGACHHGERQPEVHECIRQQCEAFLHEFSNSPAHVQLRVRSNGASVMVPEAGGMKSESIRRTLRSLVFAPEVGAESMNAQLQAFCHFLICLVSVDPDTQPGFLRTFYQSKSPVTAAAIHFARHCFVRLQDIREIASRSAGDVIYLLLGCLAGKGINEIWTRDELESLPIAHLAYMNALASATARNPVAIKRVA